MTDDEIMAKMLKDIADLKWHRFVLTVTVALNGIAILFLAL